MEKFEIALIEKDIFDITHNGNESQNPSGVRVGIAKQENLNDVAAALKGDTPSELKSMRVTVGETVSLVDLAGLIQAVKEKGMDLAVFDGSNAEQPAYRWVGGRFLVSDEAGAKKLLAEAVKHGQELEIAYGKDSKTLAKVSGDQIELNFRAKDKAQQAELVEGILSSAVKGGRNITVLNPDGQSFTVKNSGGRVEVKSSGGEILTYTPARGNYRAKLEIQLPKGADADRAAVLLRVAAELEPKQLKGTSVTVAGLDLSLGGSVKGNLSLLIQKSLWGEASSLQIGSGKDIYLESGLKGASLAYHFSTKLGLEQGNAYLAEYLAFESAKALGASGPTDAKTALMQRHYRAGSRQALELHKYAQDNEAKALAEFKKNNTAANQKKLEEATAKRQEYESYVDAHYVKVWTSLTAKLADFAKTPKQQQQLTELLEKVRDYSQREKNDFLGFKPFDGKSFADNAFELSRLINGARADSNIDLPRALRDAASLFGTEGKVEVYGAGVGIVYKMYVQDDKAALNEYNRFQTMKQEAVKSDDGYRFSIIPEDRSQGAHYGNEKFTKTPEWIVEKVDASGNTTQMLAVEVTARDGSLVDTGNIQKMIADKVFQITGHEFNKAHNQGNGLIIVRFYKAVGREDALTQMVATGLRAEYGTNASKAKAKEKIRVMVILEDPSFTGGAKTRWLEYDRGGAWKQREVGGVQETPGDAWMKPFYQAMGW